MHQPRVRTGNLMRKTHRPYRLFFPILLFWDVSNKEGMSQIRPMEQGKYHNILCKWHIDRQEDLSMKSTRRNDYEMEDTLTHHTSHLHLQPCAQIPPPPTVLSKM